MRTLCDACESAAAIVFCAADEAALCHACDEKTPDINEILHVGPKKRHEVHMCNKLASRHVRVGLISPSDVLTCDICENAPAFFYCETDGSSLCLQCDIMVHVGGKRKHVRHLLFRQKIQFPGDKPANGENPASLPKINMGEKQQNHRNPLVLWPNPNDDGQVMKEANMFDLNMKPHRIHEHTPNNQQ